MHMLALVVQDSQCDLTIPVRAYYLPRRGACLYCARPCETPATPSRYPFAIAARSGRCGVSGWYSEPYTGLTRHLATILNSRWELVQYLAPTLNQCVHYTEHQVTQSQQTVVRACLHAEHFPQVVELFHQLRLHRLQVRAFAVQWCARAYAAERLPGVNIFDFSFREHFNGSRSGDVQPPEIELVLGCGIGRGDFYHKFATVEAPAHLRQHDNIQQNVQPSNIHNKLLWALLTQKLGVRGRTFSILNNSLVAEPFAGTENTREPGLPFATLKIYWFNIYVLTTVFMRAS